MAENITIEINKKKYTFKIELLPKHIAIIMDGNGRWAKKRFLPRLAGHRAGVVAIKEIVKTIVKLKSIKYLTLYAFSTENWKRPAKEISGLMKLLVEFLKKEVRELKEEGVRIRHIGNIDRLPEFAKKELLDAEAETAEQENLNLVLALNYSGRDEMIRAVNRIVEKGEVEIDEKKLSSYLDTSFMPDPELIIRTSGELRISNFLLWQSAYAEFIFTNTFWPAFSSECLLEALEEFLNRDRRFGGI